MPKRVQVGAGWYFPANVVYVGSPTCFTSPWRSNARMRELLPLSIRHQVLVDTYRSWLRGDANVKFPAGFVPTFETLQKRRKRILTRLATLKGKDLACWCTLDWPCHADVLLELANDDSFLEVCLSEFRRETNENASELCTTAGSPSVCSHGTGQDVARI